MAEERYEEEYEEEEEEFSNPRLRRLYRQYDRLLDMQEDCEPGSQQYRNLNVELESLSREIASIEAAEHEKASRVEAETRAREMDGSKIFDRIRTVSTFVGMFIPLGVEMIRQKHEERKVDKVTKYENEGGIVKTQSMKWIK